MHRLSTFCVLLLVPLLSTCCPTLWIQVEKDSPAPWPSVALQAVEQGPYRPPAGAPNRFDVLEGGAPTVAATGYTDAPDLKDDPNGAYGRAFDGLAWIEETYKGSPHVQCTQRATLFDCGDQQDPGCHGLHFTEAVTQGRSVIVNGTRMAILNANELPTDTLQISGRVRGKKDDDVYACVELEDRLSRTLLSFVHMSDIQLRDPSVTLTDRRLSHLLDQFDPLNSFEYDEDLAYYNQYVTEAVFATINSLTVHGNPDDRPQFVIHTGDAIDSGVTSELDRFHTLIDRLNIPFFDLFGNHDVLAFGNLTPTVTHDNDETCTTVSELLSSEHSVVPNKICVDQRIKCPSCIGKEGELISRTKQEDTRRVFYEHLKHSSPDRISQFDANGPSTAYCANPHLNVRLSPTSRLHGFDLGTTDGTLDGRPLGYYAFAVPLAGTGTKRNAVFIALNSEELHEHEGGTDGRLGNEQVQWLKDVLECVAEHQTGDLVFVLAHQPLSEIHVEPKFQYEPDPKLSVAHILESSPNVVAFIRGHNHWHTICNDGRAGVCSHFWEIETASLIEFPQEGRIIRIKEVSDEIAFIELTALRERLVRQDTELARYVALGRAGAERDFCYTKRENPNVRCSADQRPYRTDGRDANARLFFRLPPIGKVHIKRPDEPVPAVSCGRQTQDPRLEPVINTIGKSESDLRGTLGAPDRELAAPDTTHKQLVYKGRQLVIELAARNGTFAVTAISAGAPPKSAQTASDSDRPTFGIHYGESRHALETRLGKGEPRDQLHVRYPAYLSRSDDMLISLDVIYDAKGTVSQLSFSAWSKK